MWAVLQLKEPADFAIMLNGEIRDPHFFRRRGDVDMYAKEVSVQNHVGLHARPATFFIQKANEYKASVWVEKEERRVNAKSLLGVLSLGIVGGTTIKIIADGADEQEAVDALVKLVETGFAE
jgi:phosphocarrier protein HPr